jgi:hypothetical protein
MNCAAVKPTFQSARLAGWKTGAPKLNGFTVISLFWLAIPPKTSGKSWPEQTP